MFSVFSGAENAQIPENTENLRDLKYHYFGLTK